MMKSRRLLLAGRSLYPLIASRGHVPRGHRRLRVAATAASYAMSGLVGSSAAFAAGAE